MVLRFGRHPSRLPDIWLDTSSCRGDWDLLACGPACSTYGSADHPGLVLIWVSGSRKERSRGLPQKRFASIPTRVKKALALMLHPPAEKFWAGRLAVSRVTHYCLLAITCRLEIPNPTDMTAEEARQYVEAVTDTQQQLTAVGHSWVRCAQ